MKIKIIKNITIILINIFSISILLLLLTLNSHKIISTQFSNFLIEIFFFGLLVSVFFLPPIISILLCKKKITESQNKFLFRIPGISLLITIIVSILIQMLLILFDTPKNQISGDMIWPIFALLYIIGTTLIGIILSLLIKYNIFTINEN